MCNLCNPYECECGRTHHEFYDAIHCKCQVKKSGEQWNDEVKDLILIYDPDGWDRKNFLESWDEPITKDEFIERVHVSTTKYINFDSWLEWCKIN